MRARSRVRCDERRYLLLVPSHGPSGVAVRRAVGTEVTNGPVTPGAGRRCLPVTGERRRYGEVVGLARRGAFALSARLCRRCKRAELVAEAPRVPVGGAPTAASAALAAREVCPSVERFQRRILILLVPGRQDRCTFAPGEPSRPHGTWGARLRRSRLNAIWGPARHRGGRAFKGLTSRRGS